MNENNLYTIVGKKNGQLVEITELPMSKENCYQWIKEQRITDHYTDVFPIPYHGNKPEHKL